MLTHSENVSLLCELALFYENCVELCLPPHSVLQDELGWLQKEIELWVWASLLTTPDGNINCLRLHLLTLRCCFFSFSFFSFACYIWVESSSSSATRRWIIGFSRTRFKVLILKFVDLKTPVSVCVCVNTSSSFSWHSLWCFSWRKKGYNNREVIEKQVMSSRTPGLFLTFVHNSNCISCPSLIKSNQLVCVRRS